MYCIEVLVTLLGFSAPLHSLGALIVIRRPGNCSPLHLRRYALITARSDAPQQTMVLSSNQRRTRRLGFSGAKFSIYPNFCAAVRETNKKVLQGDDFA